LTALAQSTVIAILDTASTQFARINAHRFWELDHTLMGATVKGMGIVSQTTATQIPTLACQIAPLQLVTKNIAPAPAPLNAPAVTALQATSVFPPAVPT